MPRLIHGSNSSSLQLCTEDPLIWLNIKLPDGKPAVLYDHLDTALGAIRDGVLIPDQPEEHGLLEGATPALPDPGSPTATAAAAHAYDHPAEAAQQAVTTTTTATETSATVPDVKQEEEVVAPPKEGTAAAAAPIGEAPAPPSADTPPSAGPQARPGLVGRARNLVRRVLHVN